MRITTSMLALAALLMTYGFAAPASTGKIAWSSSKIAVVAFPGTMQQIEAKFVTAGDLPEASVWVTPGLAHYLQPRQSVVGAMSAGAEVVVVFDLTIPAGTRLGNYEGTIHVRAGKRTVPLPQPVRISVVAATASSIPAVPSAPSPDRLVADPDYPDQFFVKDELLVGFVEDTSTTAITEKVAQYGGVFIGSYPELSVYQIQLADAALLDGALAILRSDPAVRLALHHWFMPPQKVSNDPIWTSTMSPDPDWGQQMIKLPGAWDIETGSDRVTVAVIDTGYVAPHEDFQGNYTYYDRPYTAADCQRHGTNVAGLIGAEPNNNKGLAGVMWAADIQLHTAGVGRLFRGCLIDGAKAVAAMKKALKSGARVINYSAGTRHADSKTALNESVLYEDVIKSADALFVFGAGNDSVNVNRFSPAVLAAKHANVVAVAAVQKDGALAKFSLGGSNFGSGISVAAPGKDIWTTSSDKACLLCDPGGYEPVSGTSFASPFVSGLAGLLFSYDPTLSAAEVADLIQRGAREGGAVVPGHAFHVINAERSLRLARADGQKATHRLTASGPIWVRYDAAGASLPVSSRIGDILTLYWDIDASVKPLEFSTEIQWNSIRSFGIRTAAEEVGPSSPPYPQLAATSNAYGPVSVVYYATSSPANLAYSTSLRLLAKPETSYASIKDIDPTPLIQWVTTSTATSGAGTYSTISVVVCDVGPCSSVVAWVESLTWKPLP